MTDLVLGSWEAGLVWGLGVLLKGAALLLAVLLAASALRRASAGLRHLVWGGGVLALLILPALSLALPWRLAVVPPVAPSVAAVSGASPETGVPARPAVEGGAVVQGSEASGEAAAASSAPAPVAGRGLTLRSVAQWALVMWGIVSVLLLARLVVGAVVLRRIVRRATALVDPGWTRPLIEAADRMDVEELPGLVISDRVQMPMVCGLARPVIVMPAAAEEWTDGRRRAVLCHELAHLLRRDLAVNLLGRLACVVHWFNPLAWYAAWRLRIESERACDDMVLEVGTRPSEYADHLLQIVCAASWARTPGVALPMAERRVFEGRMLAILERDARRAGPSLRHVAAAAVLAVAVAMPVAAMGPARGSGDRTTDTTAADGSESLADAPAAPGKSSSRQAVRMSARERTRESQVADTRDADPEGAARADVRAAAIAAALQLAQVAGGAAQRADTGLLAALVRALGDSAASVREDAAYALGQLELEGGAAALGNLLRRDPAVGVRRMAAWALGQIESRDGTAGLVDAFRGDAAPEVRLMAVWALGQIEDPAAVHALSAVLPRADEQLRIRIIWALGQIEPAQAPTQLLDATRDASTEVRVRAAWALGQIEDEGAVPALTAMLRDRVAEARMAAVWALGQIEADGAREALVGLLSDPDSNVRGRVLRAIAGSSEPWPWPWPMPMIR